MTVELAHPSSEPLAQRTTTDPPNPRWWFVNTTPGRILAIGTVLAMLGVLSAFAISTTINERQRQLTNVLDYTEPLAFAAGQLYTTLSVADAAAATAFISGSEPRAVRERYEQAITEAGVAVTRASSGLTDPELVELLGRTNAQLAVYTGLIETARTNNRMGNPVGASYLSEASALMQQTILPAAQRLYDATSARVDAETSDSTEIPAPVIIVVAVTLLFGVFAHRWLARHTRRRVNVGLVVGGLAIAIMIVWVGTALTVSTAESRAAKNTAADSLRTVTSLAITAQQARADETLALIRRGDEDVRKRSYDQRVESMRVQLQDYLTRRGSSDDSGLAEADQYLERWRQADARVNDYIAAGDYQRATEVALGTDDNGATAAFDELNDALSNGIESNRAQLRDDITSARRALSGTTVGGAMLSGGAALAVALGLWPRLSEYR